MFGLACLTLTPDVTPVDSLESRLVDNTFVRRKLHRAKQANSAVLGQPSTGSGIMCDGLKGTSCDLHQLMGTLDGPSEHCLETPQGQDMEVGRVSRCLLWR